MSAAAEAAFREELDALRRDGRWKEPIALESPTGPVARMGGRETILLSSNNYLGLASDPRVVEAAREGLSRYGMGGASVRFIAGTFPCHRALEEEIARFLGVEAAVTFLSCWDANIGLLPTLASEPVDAIFSDALNHASIIDAIRLSKARRFVFPHRDYARLEAMLSEARDARVKLVVTDGVFSMEGDVADLPRLKRLADAHDALLAVDESHATGVLGAKGRGSAERFGMLGDPSVIQTSTLGKSLGGACGGYVAGTRAVCDLLLQKSRPHLFSNALPPPVCEGARAALRILEAEPWRLDRVRENAGYLREGIRRLGLPVVEGETPIVPVLLGETARALDFQRRLFERGVFVSGFGYPVVPEGQARLRAQVSAIHERAHLDRALEAFAAAAGRGDGA